MDDTTHPTREEFEESAKKEIDEVVKHAKEIRESLRKLEKEISDKETKIRNYQNTLSELQQELVKVQAMLYAKGTV